MLLERGRKLAEEAQADYDVLAERGQQVTQDLLTQLDNTVSITTGAMSTARNAVVQSERVAVATLTTGIDEAENVAVKLAETAREDVEVTRTSVREATSRTRAAATRTFRRPGVANPGPRTPPHAPPARARASSRPPPPPGRAGRLTLDATPTPAAGTSLGCRPPRLM